MEDKQKHKKDLESAKVWLAIVKENNNTIAIQILEKFFPELRESEDERIRKELIERFKWELKGAEEQDAAGCSRQKDIAMFKRGLAWLEKQGEQKTIEQYTETHDLWVYIREWNDKFGRLPKDEDELASCIDYVMKRQKPAEWSEEDEKNMNKLLKAIDVNSDINFPRRYFNNEEASILRDWLKSLKPNHWKPSEEQLTDLYYAAKQLSETRPNLQILYNDIKQL